MTTSVNTVTNPYTLPNHFVSKQSRPNETTKNTALEKPENEEVDHPFAEFDDNYTGITVTRAEAERVWDQDQSKDLFGEDGLTFADLLDIVNPLQHIPVVSTIYRALTGDEIEHGSRMAGGALFGGGIGFAGALFNVILENDTGKDIGEHALAFAGINQGTKNNTHLADAIDPNVKEKAGDAVSQTTLRQNTSLAESQNLSGNKAYLGTPTVPVQSQRGSAFGGIMTPPVTIIPESRNVRSEKPNRGESSLAAHQNAPDRSSSLEKRTPLHISLINDSRNKATNLERGLRAATIGGTKKSFSKKFAGLDQLTEAYQPQTKTKSLSSSGVQFNGKMPNSQFIEPGIFLNDFKKMIRNDPKNPSPINFQNAATELPNIMLDALEKYESMMRSRQKKHS